jgi:uncharacterized protein (TIGR03435 family)
MLKHSAFLIGTLIGIFFATSNAGFCGQKADNTARPEFEVASVKPAQGNSQGSVIKALPGGQTYVARNALLIFVNAPGVRARSQSAGTSNAALPSFEVASIKLDRSNSGLRSTRLTPGRFSTTGISAKSLIEFAYSVEFYVQLSGGPSWISSNKYDVEAKVDDALAAKLQKLPLRERADQVRLMVRSLLADRFKLKVSYATRELPIYALVVAKGGPKLTPAANTGKDSFRMGGTSNGTTNELVATDASMGSLSVTLGREPELERPVVDETGLTGRYDFKLHWTPEVLSPQGNDTNGSTALDKAPLTDSSGPSLFTALREQLGLKLESRKGPVEILVIDHIERPSAD